ncbi:MAG TPA: hypothetical protein VLG27_03115 [Candidatus Saccharimonadia bacterium]|nr:hypothetical protein [Candidatus Saccharimonadia bacterium]
MADRIENIPSGEVGNNTSHIDRLMKAITGFQPNKEIGYFGLDEPWAEERQKGPHDLDLQELRAGMRVVVTAEPSFRSSSYEASGHDVILTDPIEIENYGLGKFPLIVLWARRVRDHASDSTPLNSKENIRLVDISRWQVVRTVGGPYMVKRHVKRYEPATASPSV